MFADWITINRDFKNNMWLEQYSIGIHEYSDFIEPSGILGLKQPSPSHKTFLDQILLYPKK